MTNEKAKDLLDNLIGVMEDNHDNDYDTALKMGIRAIGALEKIKADIRQIVDEETEHDETWARGLQYSLCILEKYAEQEPRTWNNHQVACLLADMFGDNCACNYNGIDEWLPDLCDFKDTCCPNPVGVACWEQFLKHSRARYCECGYEVR